MLQSRCPGSLRAVRPRFHPRSSGFASTSLRLSPQPNVPLDLEPSLQALLKDVDISLMRGKGRAMDGPPPQNARRELELYAADLSVVEEHEAALEEEELDEQDVSEPRDTRKSPAAHFGSQRIGAVVVPLELQNSINRMIASSDKSMLHTDAKRLFSDDSEEDASGTQWKASYDVKYKSRKQAARHHERDGTAFASVALPAHYSAIYAVLDHVKRRLGSGWNVERVIDWGAGTGSGLWAAAHCFQSNVEVADRQVSQSSVFTYLGIDKREGLVSIGKRLLQGIDMGKMSVSWQKSFQEDDRIRRSDAGDVVALSAFTLSSLSTPLAKKTLIKEMWESGANVMVIIDHNTTEGFENIAEARQNLLRMGRKELDDPATQDWHAELRGAHVVAPCPHDGACPLYHPGSSRLVCGFSQRLQRPGFIRRTKHSGVGHEDTGYSYIVIRRGERPEIPQEKLGRTGEVGARALKKLALMNEPIKELLLDGELLKSDMTVDQIVENTEDADLLATSSASGEEMEELLVDGELSQSATVDDQIAIKSSQDEDLLADSSPSGQAMEEHLRLEAFGWPRLVFPPLKRSGHVILDCCTPEAKIMRLTIPKSQGKQPYYDARKSSWGDIFPHEPKNQPQERYQPTRAKRQGGTTPTRGEDIGKGGLPTGKKQTSSYSALEEDVKENKKRLRRERQRTRESIYSD